MRPLAFLDVVTTGLSPERHQLLELCVLRVDSRSLEVVLEHEARVAPECLQDAQPEALQLCGFSQAAWADAVPLRDALLRVQPLLEGTQICGHQIGFAWRFLEQAFRRSGLDAPHIDLHPLDTASLAWPLLAARWVPALSLECLAQCLGLARSRPHRARESALLALHIARRFAGHAPMSLPHVQDAPAVVLPPPAEGPRHRRIYVCHPFAEDPDRHFPRVLRISRRLVARGALPITPQLYLPQLLEDLPDPARARELRLELIDTCDELRVCSSQVTAEMSLELEHAHKRSIPVAFEPEVLA